jgi:hypothetical protein
VPTEWTLEPGERIRRTALHGELGGSPRSGIAPSRKSPNVFIFSDPVAGEPHGYYDGWLGGCFHYTGEGKRGDQQMKGGNAAILNHRAEVRALRVFDGAGGTVTYVDEFELDDAQPFYRTDAHETGGGGEREVLVFRLWPKSIEPPDDSPTLRARFAAPGVQEIPLEKQHTERAEVSPSGEPYVAKRLEQKLVLELEEHLCRAGHRIFRNRILAPGEARPIETDLYDATTGMLVEAKGTVSRSAIRMAIGQLADYKRFIDDGSPNHLALLVPQEPRQDLRDLLFAQGIDVIYPTPDGFEDSAGGALTGND